MELLNVQCIFNAMHLYCKGKHQQHCICISFIERVYVTGHLALLGVVERCLMLLDVVGVVGHWHGVGCY